MKYTVMSEEAIRFLCGVINQVVSLPTDVINNINLSDTQTFSNIHIKNLIDQCLIDANDYADQVVNALTHLVAEKIDFEPTLDNTTDKINTLLLYSKNNDNNYTQYLRLTNELLNLGDTSLSLADYLKISEAASTYTKQIDFNSLKTEVDKKVNKTDIVDNLTSTDTNKPLSANQGKVLKDSIPTNKKVLDKLSENDDGELVYNGKVINTSMYISEETSEYNTNSNAKVTLYFTILGNKMTIFIIQRESNDGKTISIKYPLPFKSLPTITRTFGTPSGTEQTTKNTLTEWAYDQNYGGGKQNELHFMIQGTI